MCACVLSRFLLATFTRRYESPGQNGKPGLSCNLNYSVSSRAAYSYFAGRAFQRATHLRTILPLMRTQPRVPRAGVSTAMIPNWTASAINEEEMSERERERSSAKDSSSATEMTKYIAVSHPFAHFLPRNDERCSISSSRIAGTRTRAVTSGRGRFEICTFPLALWSTRRHLHAQPNGHCAASAFA